jgi:hypothetical protein
MAVTGRDLHRASRTWQKLTTRFPIALPQIVDDLEHWRSGIPQIISLLSATINQGSALPRSLFTDSGFYSAQMRQDAQALAADRPGLRPWLAALSWYSSLYPPEAAAALDWSRQQAAELDTIMARFGLVVEPPPSLPSSAESAVWINNYPPSLDPFLRLLDSLHTEAQKRAAGVLKKNFPDRSGLQQEIVVLRQKLSENPGRHPGHS